MEKASGKLTLVGTPIGNLSDMSPRAVEALQGCDFIAAGSKPQVFKATVQTLASGCAVLDTRKTIPGLRQAQKYAVRVGGGRNQRLALWHGILIKENHIAAAGGIPQVLEAARALDAGVEIQIEVETIAQLEEALAHGARSVLLDNFDTARMREAVAVNRGRALLEASGSVELAQLREIAATGVDRISIGTLTKDVQATDYSMRFDTFAGAQ